MKEITLPAEFLNRAIAIDLVGAGGNGSQMLYGLARLHAALLAIGHPYGLAVKLYDPDIVTEANVGRQQFSPADVGHAKAILLIHRVNVFYGLNWDAAVCRYPEDHRRADIIVGCVDSAASRREIVTCMKRDWHAWWLDLGNGERSGQVVLGRYERIIDAKRREKHDNLDRECRPPTVMELFPHLCNPKLKEDSSPSCSLAEALQRQDLFINQTVATLALNLLWTWFRTGKLDHHGYFVNLEAGMVSPMRLDPAAWQRIRANSKPKRAQPNNSRRRVRKKSKPRVSDHVRLAAVLDQDDRLKANKKRNALRKRKAAR